MIPRQPDYRTRTILRCVRILLASLTWLVVRGPAFGQYPGYYYPPRWHGSQTPAPQQVEPPTPAPEPDDLTVQPEPNAPTIQQVSASQLPLAESKPAERPNPRQPTPSLVQAPAVTRLQSEDAWQRRLQAEAAAANKQLVFPQDAPLPSERPPHGGPLKKAQVEPYYVCYGPLSFEQRNSERYGWDLGPVQPPLSAGVFYVDLVTAPLKWMCNPWRTEECSAGQCLPGDPVPYLVELPYAGSQWRAIEPAGR
jgi:hypothetical protein